MSHLPSLLPVNPPTLPTAPPSTQGMVDTDAFAAIGLHTTGNAADDVCCKDELMSVGTAR